MTNVYFCDECLEDKKQNELDTDFDFPICFDCSEKLSQEWEDFSDDFPLSLEYDEG